MGETLALFRPSVNNESLRVDSRPERLTGEPGAVLLREIMERTRIIDKLTERLHDPCKADGAAGGAVRTIPNSEEFSLPLSRNSTTTVNI